MKRKTFQSKDKRFFSSGNIEKDIVRWSTIEKYAHLYTSASLAEKSFFLLCTVGQKRKTKHLYLFQYKLSYRNETGTNHHGLLSTSI